MGASVLSLSADTRVVLDTNVLLSALVFTGGRLGQLRHAWQARSFQPVTTKQTIQELIRVLGYPRFKLDSARRESLLADFLPYAFVVEHMDTQRIADLPPCRDPKDQMFLELALSANAQFLVTGDEDLLCMNDANLPFQILTPAHFLEQFA